MKHKNKYLIGLMAYIFPFISICVCKWYTDILMKWHQYFWDVDWSITGYVVISSLILVIIPIIMAIWIDISHE